MNSSSLSISVAMRVLCAFFFFVGQCNSIHFAFDNIINGDDVIVGFEYDCSTDPQFSPDMKNTVERAAAQGFECQCHAVVTLDNYIIRFHRMGAFRGPPVLLLHGYLTASEQWLVRSRSEDLPSILADKGFDVWIGNFRGNTYGRNHTYLSPDQQETSARFWNFTLHELGYYDVPSMVDYIRKVSGGGRAVSLVGYSIGATVALITASTRPDYNHKINLIVLLAPYAFTSKEINLQALFQHLHIDESIESFMHEEEPMEIFSRKRSRIRFFNRNCGPRSLSHFSCVSIIVICFGVGQVHHHNKDALHKMLISYMSGTSSKLVEHMSQMFHEGKLLKYQYNENDEIELYPLKKIAVPVSVHSSVGDNVADPASMELLIQHLPEKSLIGRYLIPESYTHIDYFLSRNARKDVYRDIIDTLNKVKDNHAVTSPYIKINEDGVEVMSE
nr:putative salivary protein [Nilaparvata lugens]